MFLGGGSSICSSEERGGEAKLREVQETIVFVWISSLLGTSREPTSDGLKEYQVVMADGKIISLMKTLPQTDMSTAMVRDVSAVDEDESGRMEGS